MRRRVIDGFETCFESLATRTCVALAATLWAAVAVAAPVEQHLSWSGNPSSSIDVTWTDASSAAGTVQYGPTAAYGSSKVEASSPTLIPGETIYSHHVQITGLSSGTVYHYAIPSGSDRTFTTSAATSFSFAAWGDQGTTSTVGTTVGGGCGLPNPGGAPGMAGIPEATATQAGASGAALGVYLGDCSYGNGSGSAPWDAWYAANTPFSANASWLVTVGNHDEANGQGPGTAIDGQNFYGRLFFPSPFSSSGNAAWWSVDYGGVHFIFLNADNYGSAAQLAWLDSDLQSAAAKSANWRVVVMHQPAFSSSCYGGDPYETGAKNAFVPKFDQYTQTAHIDLVLQGHRHIYERTYMLTGVGPTIDTASYNASSKSYTIGAGKGTVYMTTGGGGHSLHGFSGSPAWSANRKSFFHWLKVNVTPSSLVIDVHDTAANGIFETFTLSRSGAPPVDMAGPPVDMAVPPGSDLAVPPGSDLAVPPGSDLAAPPGSDLASVVSNRDGSAGVDLGGGSQGGGCNLSGRGSSASPLAFLMLLGFALLFRRFRIRHD